LLARQQLKRLHDIAPLDRALLNERFDDLLRDVVGDAIEARWARYHLICELWTPLDADDVDPTTSRPITDKEPATQARRGIPVDGLPVVASSSAAPCPPRSRPARSSPACGECLPLSGFCSLT
jgi:hypothetical protein